MEYASNSNKSKEKIIIEVETDDGVVVEPKVTKVVTGTAIVQKKGIGKKLHGIFFGGEFKSASRYVVADVLLPAARDMVVDIITKGVERVVYGERYSSSRRRSPEYRGNVQYNSPVRREYRSSILPGQPPRIPNRINRRESSDVLIESREEANLVLQTMVDCVEKYEQVSMADLNELLGLQSANIDHRWGWTTLNEASIRQTRDGYLLELPPMEEL